jgi:hypothetical protein
MNRQLDALVAEHVMGWKKSNHLGSVIYEGKVWAYDMSPDDASESYVNEEHLPRFSTSIADAWLVVEKMAERSSDWSVCEGITAAFLTDEWHDVTADTAPEAICLAALKAVGYDK